MIEIENIDNYMKDKGNRIIFIGKIKDLDIPALYRKQEEVKEKDENIN